MSMESSKRDEWCSASDLAQMGVCEGVVVFEGRHGKRKTPVQVAESERGIAAHKAFYEEHLHGASKSPPKRWCFVATLAYGEAALETSLLRRFRDERLRPSSVGRALVRLYYRHSPRLCAACAGRPWAVALLRMAIRPALALAAWSLRRRGRGQST